MSCSTCSTSDYCTSSVMSVYFYFALKMVVCLCGQCLLPIGLFWVSELTEQSHQPSTRTFTCLFIFNAHFLLTFISSRTFTHQTNNSGTELCLKAIMPSPNDKQNLHTLSFLFTKTSLSLFFQNRTVKAHCITN